MNSNDITSWLVIMHNIEPILILHDHSHPMCMCYCIPKYIFAIILKKDIPNADLTTQTKKMYGFQYDF